MQHQRLTSEQIEKITEFTGAIDADQVRYVDSFVGQQMALFMPIAGPCQLAVSHLHTHPSHMFVINFSDSSSIVFKNSIYRPQIDKVYFLHANIPHHEVNDSEIPRYVAIFVKPDFLEAQAQAYKNHKLGQTQWATFDKTEELLYSVKQFINESKLQRPAYKILLEALSIQIIHILLRSMLHIQTGESSIVSRNEIERSIEYMRQHLSEKLTIQMLASQANMSASHFTRVFRFETDRSPIDYLIEIRLEHACRKLMSKEQTMKQIALECGFSSPAHFSSSFQKKYKISPSEYLQASIQK